MKDKKHRYDPCGNCLIRQGCDFLSEMCRLTPTQVVSQRKDLIFVRPKPQPSRKQLKVRARLTAIAHERKAIAALGFKKYDRRRKPDTPERMLWRLYKVAANDGNIRKKSVEKSVLNVQ